MGSMPNFGAGLTAMGLTEMIAVASLMLNIGIAAVGATWGIAKIKDAVRTAMDEHKAEFEGKIESLRRETGEVASALRQKVHDNEIWVRDNMVSKTSYGVTIDTVRADIRLMGERIEGRILRMENKLDQGRPG